MTRSAAGHPTINVSQQDWPVVAFGDIVKMVSERVDPGETDLEVYVGLEHLDPESLKIRRHGTPEDVTGQKLKFYEGDIIFGKRRAYQRKLAVAHCEGICSAHAMVLRAKPGVVLPEFLPFLMQSDMFMERAVAISVGSLSPTINWKTLKVQEFPLPPVDEQRRIAQLLWAADEVVERYRVLADQLWANRGTFVDHYVPSPADYAPESVKPLGDLCEMQNGKPFPSKHYGDDGLRLIRPGNLGSDGRFLWTESNTVQIADDISSQAPDHIVEPGDVVINLTAQSLDDAFIGRVCLAGPSDRGLLNQRLGRFFCGDQLDPRYLFRCLQSQSFRQLVESRCEGSKVRHTYFRHFEDLPIVVVDREQQSRIANHLDRCDQARLDALSAMDAAQGVLAGIREQHLTRGRL